MVKKIIGLQPDGNCLAREQMPGKMTMECRFDEPYRKIVADFVRQTQAAKESTTRAKIAGGGREVTTRLDGRPVKNPLQEAMKKGYCQVVMPKGVAKPKRSTPAPVKRIHSQPKKTVRRAAPPKRVEPTVQPSAAPGPDLAVAGVKLDARCRPVVTLENRGSRGLPATAYERSNSAGIQLYKNGKPWQGVALFGFDRTRALLKPGGRAVFTLFQPIPADTSTRVKIVADSRNQIREALKRNNTLEVKLRCSGSE
ncbi:MAG: hypothetical protein ABW166_14735 [Sedimenticola sp.]